MKRKNFTFQNFLSVCLMIMLMGFSYSANAQCSLTENLPDALNDDLTAPQWIQNMGQTTVDKYQFGEVELNGTHTSKVITRMQIRELIFAGNPSSCKALNIWNANGSMTDLIITGTQGADANLTFTCTEVGQTEPFVFYVRFFSDDNVPPAPDVNNQLDADEPRTEVYCIEIPVVLDKGIPTIDCVAIGDGVAMGLKDCADSNPFATAGFLLPAAAHVDDNCTSDTDLLASMDVEVTSSPSSVAGACYRLTRVIKITDNAGQMASCTQIVDIEDTSDPVLLEPASASTMFKNLDADNELNQTEFENLYNRTIQCGDAFPAALDLASLYEDNCSDSPSISISGLSNDVSVVGGNVILGRKRTYTATDNCGNSTAYTQIISVEDNVDPVIHSVAGYTATLSSPGIYALDAAAKINVNLDRNTCDATATISISADDACDNNVDIFYTVTDLEDNSPYANGPTSSSIVINGLEELTDYRVDISVFDDAGNESKVSIEVCVSGISPELECKADAAQVTLDGFGFADVGFSDIVNKIEDPCGPSCVVVIYQYQMRRSTSSSWTNVTSSIKVNNSECSGISGSGSVSALNFDCDDAGKTITIEARVRKTINGKTVTAKCSREFQVEAGNNEVKASFTKVKPQVGLSDGSITVNASTDNGGTGFTYSIGGGAFQASDTFSGLAAGTYEIRVMSSIGCTSTFECILDNGLPPLKFTYESTNGAKGATRTICVTADNFDDITGFTLNLAATAQVVTIVSVTPSAALDAVGDLLGTTSVTFIADDPVGGENLAPGTEIFCIVIELSQNIGTSSFEAVAGTAKFTSAPDGLTEKAIMEVSGSIEVQALPPTRQLGGIVSNRFDDPVSGVMVNMTNATATINPTDNTGSYCYTGMDGSKTISFAPKMDNWRGSGTNTINGQDASKAFEEFAMGDKYAGADPYDAERLMVADFDGDGTFDLNEVVAIRIIAQSLGDSDAILNDVKNQGWMPWKMPAPFSTVVTTDNKAMHAKIYKMGNVCRSCTTADPRNINETIFNIKDVAIKTGQTYQVDFTAKNFENLRAMDLELSFNPNVLNFVDVKTADLEYFGGDNFNLSQTNNGTIAMVWAHYLGQNITEGDKMFSLTFTAKADAAKLSEVFGLGNQYFPSQGYKQSLNPSEVVLDFGNVVASNNEFSLMQNAPNPFKNSTSIEFTLPENQAAKLSIFDVTGKLIRVYEDNYVKGLNQITVLKNDLPATGVVFYQLETAQNSAIKKMIILD